jgi:endoglucanase
MIRHRATILALGLALLTCVHLAEAADATTKIRLNTVGYLPGRPKRATIAAPCTQFRVVRVDDSATAFEGKATGPAHNADTNEDLFTADFSPLRAPGRYRLEVPGVGSSAPFRVDAHVYHAPFVTVTRGMYLWRCGTAVSGRYEGQTFAHAACHLEDAWLDVISGRHDRKDSTRGWHDAGDYNKYVVNAGVTVGSMFRAWEDFGPRIQFIRLDLPEAGGTTPEFLAEVRWELEWLLTMQAENGSVYHKVSTRRFGGFLLPEREVEPRFLVPWSSAATADFVAMTAAASRIYRRFDPSFADRCLSAARKSAGFLKAHPAGHGADQKGFTTGGYSTSDPDDRLWASAELWETTGDPEALRDLELRIRGAKGHVDGNWDWGDVRNLGLLTYLTSKRSGRDSSLVASVRDSLLKTADEIVKTRDGHGYARPLGSLYYWGCNGTVARQVLVLQAAYRIEPKSAYREAGLDALNHLFGRNVHGRSYVTGLGHLPPLHPHDRRSGGDKVDAPWPGYLVGGPHPKPADWHDDQADYRTNEIAINWNGALIYALAAFLDDPAP